MKFVVDNKTKEAVVPYEIGKKIKDLGFNYGCYYFCFKDDPEHIKRRTDGTIVYNSDFDDSTVCCPTLDVVNQWLRNVKKIPIQMIYSTVKDEWASCVDDKYFWETGYYRAMMEAMKYIFEIQ
jgi:hypothetical protein